MKPSPPPTMKEPKLYQIIPGGDLQSHQLALVLKAFPGFGLEWVVKYSFYFSRNGSRFMEVWA